MSAGRRRDSGLQLTGEVVISGWSPQRTQGKSRSDIVEGSGLRGISRVTAPGGGHPMRYAGIGFCVVLVCLIVAPVQAQVHVDIGIHFPAPPPLVVIPEAPQVQYVPPTPA